MKINHVKVGIALSYILMILNAIYGFIVTPILIKYAGSGNYGVYKTISSLTTSILVLDLGLGDTTIKYISKFRAEKENDKIPNFIAMVLIIASGLCLLVSFVCFIMSFFLEPLYGSSFDMEQFSLAINVFIACSINIVVHIITNVFNGVISGLNKFALSHSISIFRLLFRTVFGILLIVLTKNILYFVYLDLIISILTVFVEFLFIRFKYKIRIKLSKWDKKLFIQSSKFSILMFLSAVAGQICTNLDNIIIGSICGPDYVTIYSVGVVIYVMFGNISCAVSSVMLPTITNILNEENSDEKLANLLIKVGRLQFILLAACIVGFAILGKDFINIWMGNGFEDAYIITLILIVPSIFEYCINTALAILKAKDMFFFRTISLFIACIVNLIVTIVLVKYWSYIGAAIGTSITYLLCSLIMMNIYYSFKVKLPMMKIYIGIIKRIWICLLLAGLALFIYNYYLHGNIFTMIGGIFVFSIIYAICLLLFGLSNDEKQRIPVLNKFFNKKVEEK